jgi:hypothetical protein
MFLPSYGRSVGITALLRFASVGNTSRLLTISLETLPGVMTPGLHHPHRQQDEIQ